ncbi:MAG TPA: protein phosphatase 2C domain-containing protein [Vicinamibacterales bacterium]|nr:protein phosphatase 2C domain-containing protein [Vicinamibacterales bacterium]
MTNQDVVDQPTFPKVEVAVASEQGLRDENQDWLSWTQTPRGELFVIADGMGGYKGGALAAKMTVDTVEASVSEAPPESSFGKAVTEALSEANREVHLLAHSGNPDTENMGSTALVVLLSDGSAHIAHVGDSRAYLLRNNKLQLLTRDHTRVQQMIDAKMLTPEQARNHPESHLLSRAIGSREEVEVEISGPVPLNIGDALLLCSDGLSGFVTDEEIHKTLKKHRDVQRVPQELVNLALSAGGNDNITIHFVRVDGTVRKRVTARMPVSEVIAQGRTGDAFATLAKRGVLVFAGIAVVLVLAVYAMSLPSMQNAIATAKRLIVGTSPAVADRPAAEPQPGTQPATPPAASTPSAVVTPIPASTPRVDATTAPARVTPPAPESPRTAKPPASPGTGNATGRSTGKGNASTPPAPSKKKPSNEPADERPLAEKPSPVQQSPATNQPPTDEPPPANEQPQAASPSQRPASDAPRQGQEPAVNTPPGQPDDPRK